MSKELVALCTYPMGLAHTFMAAQALEKAAVEAGYEVRIETQDADGIQNRLTAQDIVEATIVTHSVAVTPEGNERFESHDVYEITLQDVIKNATGIIKEIGEMTTSKQQQYSAGIITMAIKKRSATVAHGASSAATAVKDPQASEPSFWGEPPQHVMSGISRMVPTLTVGGAILAFSQLIAYDWLKIPIDIDIMDALNSGKFSDFSLSSLRFVWLSQSLGGVLSGFAIPMLAAFVASSISGKLAFPAGFIGGLIPIQPMQPLNFDPSTMQWVTSSSVPSTLIGALIIFIVAGHLVKWINQKIQLPDFLLAFKTTFLLPTPPTIFVMLTVYYVIIPFGDWINDGTRTVLIAAGEKGALMYAMGIAAVIVIDLGGPINKTAGFVAFNLIINHVLPVTARSIVIATPLIGLGLATIINCRLTGKRLFNAQLYPQGKTAIFLAFTKIGEGATPLALENPITAIPSYMVDAIIDSTTAVWLGAVQWFPESAIWAWPLVTDLGVYMVGIALGTVITVLMVALLCLMMFRKGKLLIDSP